MVRKPLDGDVAITISAVSSSEEGKVEKQRECQKKLNLFWDSKIMVLKI